MKKALAAILALVLLAALVPTVAAAEGDFELVINGGETNANMAVINEQSCLKVDVYLNGITDEKMLASTNFALLYDTDQLTYFKNSYDLGVHSLYTVDSSGHESHNYMFLVNEKEAGEVLIAMATTYGCKLKDGMPFITLYFTLNGQLTEGTEISFTLNSAATIESISLDEILSGGGKTVKRTLTTDFKPYTVSGVKGIFEWNTDDVQFKGETAYVLYNGKAQTPRFYIKNSLDGSVIDPSNYDYEYKENTQAGTGYVFVTLKNAYAGECKGTFKIYLPATTKTTVENIDEGIKVTWEPVEGAAGYVIYRRAWNLVDNGWTTFARWNNTTQTTYIDGVDASHKVYAGTRYQYGVKAYFTRRLDPIAGAEIGGNVNDNSGNFNLGMVGPLKTTVRITTRKLTSVTGGSKQLTVKWEGSKNFTGYEVQIATNAAFTSNLKTVKITNAKTYQTTIKSLKARTTYYARVRSYHEFNGMTYYGGWSNVLSGKTK